MRLLVLFLPAAQPSSAQQKFYPFAVDQDQLSGAPDFSILNQPITSQDRVVVRKDKFVRAADGTPLRFFVVNLAFEPTSRIRRTPHVSPNACGAWGSTSSVCNTWIPRRTPVPRRPA